MQVSVERLDGLERRMKVQVPADEIDKKIEGRLRSLSKKARVDGFRPGKVPYKVVKRLYGPQVRQEIIGDVLEHSLQDAFKQQELRIAGNPRIDSLTAEEGNNLEYSAVFEVFPEFEAKGVDDLKVERPQVEIADSDVDGMIEKLREQRAIWNGVERPAAEKDRLTLDFEGTIDGRAFSGNKGEGLQLVLGSGRMIPGFEDQLVGRAAGDEVEFDLAFPDDYPGAEVAGKQAHFRVNIASVEEPELPRVDEAFASSFGVQEGGVDKLREALRDNMQRELDEAIKNRIKQQVMQTLLDANDIDLPKSLIDAEVNSIAAQSEFKPDTEDEQRAMALKRERFEPMARRRVALGLIISSLVNQHDIKLDPERVQVQLENIAASYEDKQQVIAWYRQQPRLMEGVNTMVMEDQVVDWLLARAEVVDKPQAFDEFMKPKGEPTHG